MDNLRKFFNPPKSLTWWLIFEKKPNSIMVGNLNLGLIITILIISSIWLKKMVPKKYSECYFQVWRKANFGTSTSNFKTGFSMFWSLHVSVYLWHIWHRAPPIFPWAIRKFWMQVIYSNLVSSHAFLEYF